MSHVHICGKVYTNEKGYGDHFMNHHPIITTTTACFPVKLKKTVQFSFINKTCWFQDLTSELFYT